MAIKPILWLSVSLVLIFLGSALYLSGSASYSNSFFGGFTINENASGKNNLVYGGQQNIGKVNGDKSRYALRFGLIYTEGDEGIILITNTTINVTRCWNMTDLIYQPNLTLYFNMTSNTITAPNVIPTNQSACGYTYNVTNIGNALTDVTAFVNATDQKYNLFCNNVNVTGTKIIYENLDVGENLRFNCTLSYINASSAYKFTLNFTGG